MFSSATAPPEHRRHQKAVMSVLKALLPETWTTIKGHMRSYRELLEVSGYAAQPQEFAALLQILDRESRLITPTDPEGINAERETPLAVDHTQAFYQLTHDYLVSSIREWLIRKQRESRQGRAELRLSVWSSVWNNKPENRNLPSLWEYLSIRFLTERKIWTEPQQKMMRRAGRVHAMRSTVAAGLMLAAVMTVLSIRSAVIQKQNATRAEGLVSALANADIAQVPALVTQLEEYREWADPLLRNRFEEHVPIKDVQPIQSIPDGSGARVIEPEDGSSRHLNVALALLPVDRKQIEYLRRHLPTIAPRQFTVVRDALLPYQAAIVGPLWEDALADNGDPKSRFQAACALATYAPDDDRWTKIRGFVAGHLVSLQATDFVACQEALRPARRQFLEPLTAIFNDAHQQEQIRMYAAEALSDFAWDRPELLFDLVATADPFQFKVVFLKLISHPEKAVALARAELAAPLPDKSEAEKENLARRQANAAVALYKLKAFNDFWPVLRFSPDPRVRSYVIHWLAG
jgi:eukaryotic-like serine/threonine-protein kinase